MEPQVLHLVALNSYTGGGKVSYFMLFIVCGSQVDITVPVF